MILYSKYTETYTRNTSYRSPVICDYCVQFAPGAMYFTFSENIYIVAKLLILHVVSLLFFIYYN